jgi:hypothetical protein
VRSSAWLIGFYAVTILLSWLGSFGGLGVIGHPFDTVVVAAWRWASTTGARPPACRHTWCAWKVTTRRSQRRCTDLDRRQAGSPLPPSDFYGTDKPMKQIHVIDSHTGGEPTRLVMKASRN